MIWQCGKKEIDEKISKETACFSEFFYHLVVSPAWVILEMLLVRAQSP